MLPLRTHLKYFLTEFCPPVIIALALFHLTLQLTSTTLTLTTKHPTMKVFKHPHNMAIIATDNDHAVYVPASSPSDPKAQLVEAEHLLTESSKRCFDYSQDLSDLPQNPISQWSKQHLPDPSKTLPAHANHEPETPPDPNNSQT